MIEKDNEIGNCTKRKPEEDKQSNKQTNKQTNKQQATIQSAVAPMRLPINRRNGVMI